MVRPFEFVHTVTDYRDGPRAGIADFAGVPHSYRALFSEAADDWDENRFELCPMSARAFALAMEAWAIWKRFDAAFRSGQVNAPADDKDWGALPEDRPRRDELRTQLEHALADDSIHRFVARGDFRTREPITHDLPVGVLRPLEVRWIPIEEHDQPSNER